MLFGHLARMDETADARRILSGVHQSDWSRPVGRPYTSWMATLKSDLSLHNLTFQDAIELALDKSLWRLLVASGATHWHGAWRIMMMMMTSPTFTNYSTSPAISFFCLNCVPSIPHTTHDTHFHNCLCQSPPLMVPYPCPTVRHSILTIGQTTKTCHLKGNK